MNRIVIVFFAATTLISAQNFQPPSWAQPADGHGSGQGAGQGQGQGSGQGSNTIQGQINQLQTQIEKLRGNVKRFAEDVSG